MPFRDPAFHLEQMLDHIAHIQEFSKDLTFEDYLSDMRTRLAIERLLQNVTEDARRLGEEAAVLCPSIDWRSIRGMGNQLPHEYDQLIDERIGTSVTIDLPPLKIAAESALKTLRSKALKR